LADFWTFLEGARMVDQSQYKAMRARSGLKDPCEPGISVKSNKFS